MVNLYIFNESTPAAVYGIGTYIKELTATLNNSGINVCVVNLRSDKSEVEITEIEGVRHWYIPLPSINSNNYLNYKAQNEGYYRNITYLLQLYVIKNEHKKNLVFQVNYMKCKPLVDFLRTAFDCKIVLVVHYLNSILTLMGNISRFRRIISQTNPPTDQEEKSTKEYYLKEKELFHAVDKIICLSNHTFDLLLHDYQIEKEKMVVIPNGLSDVFN